MLEIVSHRPTAETGGGRQDRVFQQLVGEILRSPDAVNLEFSMLPPSLHNEEKRYNRILILDREKGLKIAVRDQWTEYNSLIMPNNFRECLIADDCKKTLTRLRLYNIPDEPLSVTNTNNFPQNIISKWEQGDAFRLFYNGSTGTLKLEDIDSEQKDGENTDILLDIIRTAEINPGLTQKTKDSWLRSDASVSVLTGPTFSTPVNVLGRRPGFVKVTV